MAETDSDDNTIWSKGDQCMVQWSGDDQYYKAKILKFVLGDSGEKEAFVSFEGFTEEENESIPLCRLKKIRRKSPRGNNDVQCLGDVSPDSHVQSMFSPLTGSEEERRLSEKYHIIDKEEQYSNITRNSSSPRNVENRQHENRKKKVVASGGKARNKETSREMSKSTQDTQSLGINDTYGENLKPVRKVRIPTGLTSSESEDDGENATHVSGFSDLDMEKPYFLHIAPCGSKVPFVLSEPNQVPVVQVPATMNQYLRDYQREGIRFLYKHYATSQGAILADDMGLGKTVQVIGFLSAVLNKTGTKLDVMKSKPAFIRKMSENASVYEQGANKKPFLVIGPATVMYNWVEEFQTWGHFSVGKFHRNHKDDTLAELRKSKLDIVVTTYETCRDHIDVINEFSWEAVIADEAHKIKSMKAEVTQALKKLNCEKRYGLTGTPLQNNLAEFWCILDWANSNCLGALSTFKNNVCKILDRGQKQDATKRELAEARCVQEQLAKVKEKWMLRRTKQIIADQLPRKEELVVYCKMAGLQSEIYKTIMSQEDMHYILTQRQPCTCGSETTRGTCCYSKTPEGHSLKSLTFTYMHLLLKAANHVALLLPKHIESEKQIKYAKKVCEEVFDSHPEFLEQNREASFRTLSDPKYCGKMKVLTGLLSVYRKRNGKILLFSYSTRLLNIIEQYVIGKGYEYRRLDGDTPHSKRMSSIREFNKDPNVFLFLVSTKAGGVGLNLTGANVVIIFDPNWNPVHDLQAQDRAYRLGQVRDVKVYRLICSGTIEENIYLRQIYKQQRANIAVEAQNARRYFHRGELFGIENMFLMKDSDKCLTEDILKRNRKVEDGLKMFRIEEYVPSSVGSDVGQDEQEYDISQSENMKRIERSPDNEQRATSRTGTAKAIVYSSGNDSSGEDAQLPFTSFTSVKNTAINNFRANRNARSPHTGNISNKEKTANLCSTSVDFHDSQVASTSASGALRKEVRQSQALQEELDDLWDSFSTVKEDDTTQYDSKSEAKSKYSGTKVKNSKRPVNGTLVKNGCDAHSFEKRIVKTGRSDGSCGTKSWKLLKRQSSGSDDSDINEEGNHGMEAKRLKLKSADGKGVKGRSKKQERGGAVDDKVDRNRLNGDSKRMHEEKTIKSRTPERKSVSFKHQVSKKKGDHADGSEVEKTDVSAMLNATFESVSDVLDQCGVVHTHHNQRIVGSSKAEDHMTRCAMKDVYELHQHTQAPAMLCEPFSQSSEESDDLGRSLTKQKCSNKRRTRRSKSGEVDESHTKKSMKKKASKKNLPQKRKESSVNEARTETLGNRKVLIGQTPKGIRKQQFTFLCHSLGLDPAILAKQIVFSTPVNRIKLLRQFYASQETDLDPVLESMQSLAQPVAEKQTDSEAGKNNRKGKRKQTSARAAREKVQFSRRKKSSNGGVSYIDQYDTDSSLSDAAIEKSRKTFCSSSQTQQKLIQPTLEVEYPISASDNESKRKTAFKKSKRTKHIDAGGSSSGSETKLDHTNIPQPSFMHDSDQYVMTGESEEGTEEDQELSGKNVKSINGSKDEDGAKEGDVDDRNANNGEECPVDEKTKGDRENFDYLDELFF